MTKGENNLGAGIIKFIIVCGLFLFQAIVIAFLIKTSKEIELYANVFFELLKLALVLMIIYKPGNSSFKIAWIILIMFFPIFGFLLYLLSGNLDINKKLKKQNKKFEKNYILNNNVKMIDVPKEISNQFEFAKNVTDMPFYKASDVKYFKLGEEYFKNMIEDLKNAKEYILFEYYIISKSNLWDEIYEILKNKVKEGVKVYLSFDEMGSLFSKPKNFKERLQKAGINAVSFNPITPILKLSLSYRNHRKITVIDGNIAYTGGINIGDEYINEKERFGHWKDTGIRITGKPVLNFIKMFSLVWYYHTNEILKFKEPHYDMEKKGYVIPYCDSPMNKQNPSEMIYMNMINSATESVYITTPYLILDNEMITALCNAARKGVDVKIITPYIPDKKTIKACTISFYGILLEAGVHIYEYTPGFIHAKNCVVDNKIASVGTANFDYRSLYWNYECGVLSYGTGEEKKVAEDFLETISKSNEITLQKWNQRSFITKVKEAVLKALAPLL